ncbi:MAG TPA: patatin-like phospholipase family protein [Stellaceae bacterium]
MTTSDLHIGLALGSGVARGWAHIGALRALERSGIKPEIVCGTSIGALVGATYLAGRLGELEDWARRLNKLRLSRLFDFQFGRGGLIAGRRIVDAFPQEFRNQLIEELPARFACVATELGTGHEVWLQRGNLVDALRASYALPGVFAPVRIDGRWLLDGALVNPVPVSVCRALGSRLVIAVNLNADAFGGGMVETEDEIGLGEGQAAIAGRLNGLPGAAVIRQLFSRRNSDEPSLFSVMASSLNIVQDRLTRSRLAGDPPDVTIAPKLGNIGLMEFDRAEESIAAGEQAVEAALPALKDAMRRLNGRK